MHLISLALDWIPEYFFIWCHPTCLEDLVTLKKKMKCCIQLYLNHVYPKLDTLVGGTTPPLNRLVAARLVTAVTPSPDNESPRVCCSSKLMNH